MKTLLMAAIALMIATTGHAESCNKLLDDYAGVVTLEKYCSLTGHAKSHILQQTVDNNCPEPSKKIMMEKITQQRVEFAELLQVNPNLCESEAAKNIIGY